MVNMSGCSSLLVCVNVRVGRLAWVEEYRSYIEAVQAVIYAQLRAVFIYVLFKLDD